MRSRRPTPTGCTTATWPLTGYGEYYPTVGITQSGSPGSYTYSVSYTASAWNSYVAYDRSLYLGPGGGNTPGIRRNLGRCRPVRQLAAKRQPPERKGPGRRRRGRTRSTGDTQSADGEPATPGRPTSSRRKTNGTKRPITSRAPADTGLPDPEQHGAQQHAVRNRNEQRQFRRSYPKSNYTDPTNYLTPVGAFSASPGPYGTYDMGGDVLQWDEANDGCVAWFAGRLLGQRLRLLSARPGERRRPLS